MKFEILNEAQNEEKEPLQPVASPQQTVVEEDIIIENVARLNVKGEDDANRVQFDNEEEVLDRSESEHPAGVGGKHPQGPAEVGPLTDT